MQKSKSDVDGKEGGGRVQSAGGKLKMEGNKEDRWSFQFGLKGVWCGKKLVYITGPRNDPSSIEPSGILPGPRKFIKAVIFRVQLSPVATVTFNELGALQLGTYLVKFCGVMLNR